MVSQATKDLALQIVDANIEMNTKIFFFIILLGYLIFLLWLSFRMFPSNSEPKDVKFSIFLIAGSLRILSCIFLFFYPLYVVVFMYRNIALEEIMRYLFFSYTIMGLLLGIYGMIFGFERFFQLVGLNLFEGKRKRRFRRPR